MKKIKEKIIELWKKSNWYKTAIVVLGLITAILTIVASWKIALFIVNIWNYFWSNFFKEDFNSRLKIIKNGLWILGGILGFWFASARLIIADKNQKTEQKKELHERYARAVELLKDENEAVRMGGLYSLQQISEETEVFFEQCKEIIAGYVRNRLASKEWKESKAKWEEEQKPDYEKSRTLPDDVRTGISILSALAKSKYFKDKYINLQGVDLSGVNFFKIDTEFNCLDFNGSDFTKCYFKTGTNLSSCRFASVTFKEAIFPSINFRGTDLCYANFNNASFVDSDFSGANLKNSNFYLTFHSNKINFENALLDSFFCSKEFFEKSINKDDYIFIDYKEFDDKFSTLNYSMKKWFGDDYKVDDFKNYGVVKLKTSSRTIW